MQYHLCVCIFRHARPSKLVDPGVGRYCITLYLVEIPFGDSYYIFRHFILFFIFYLFIFVLLKIQHRVLKKKKSRLLVSNILGRSEKGKQTIFLGLMQLT